MARKLHNKTATGTEDETVTDFWHLRRDQAGMNKLTKLLYTLGLYLMVWAGHAFAEPTAADVERAVADYVAARVDEMPVSESAGRIEIEVQPIDSRLRLSECFTPLDMNSGAFQGFGRLNVRVSCRDPRPWVLYVPVNVAIYRDAVVAAAPIARGQVIGPHDLSTAAVNVLDTGGHHLEDPESAFGMQARRDIRPGKLVTRNLLQAPMIVRRGDEVRVLARLGDVAVRVTGTALGDGRLGQQIRVRNGQSERIIRAVVLGPGEVEAIL